MDLLEPGQGRDANDMDCAAVGVTVCGTIFALVAAFVVVSCLGCGSRFGILEPRQVQDDFPQPPGDELPAPKRVEMQRAMIRAFLYARHYSAEHKVAYTGELPELVICRDEDEIIRLTDGKREAGKKLAGRCAFGRKTIYVVGADISTLYHELGNWFFGNQKDEVIAGRFAWYCLKMDAYLDKDKHFLDRFHDALSDDEKAKFAELIGAL